MTTKTHFQDLRRSIADTQALFGQARIRRVAEAHDAPFAAAPVDHAVVRGAGRGAGIGVLTMGTARR